jgi:uncharacterized membrane protein
MDRSEQVAIDAPGAAWPDCPASRGGARVKLKRRLHESCDDGPPRPSPGAVMKLLLPTLAVVLTMIALDVVWIGIVARSLYDHGIGHLMAAQPNLVAALAFYVLYAIGLMAFVVVRQAPGDRKMAAAWGAAFGFMTYMTYDLTNLATLRDWPLALSCIDVAWGCLATSLAAAVGRAAADRANA